MPRRLVEQNDPAFTNLEIGIKDGGYYSGGFQSTDGNDYCRIAIAIGRNTHLTKLKVALESLPEQQYYYLTRVKDELFDSLKCNSSISDLELAYLPTMSGGLAHKILKAYHENNSNLTRICIKYIHGGNTAIINDTLRCCMNIKTINLAHNNITDEQLLPLVEAIRGHRMLEELILFGMK